MNRETRNSRQGHHDVLPVPSQDENARQEFVGELRRFLTANIQPALSDLYEAKVLPEINAALGRDPETASEVRAGMKNNPLYQLWSAMQRRSQEMIWSSAIDTVERNWEADREKISASGNTDLLSLDPDLEVPSYHTAYDIHLQPGGYHGEHAAADHFAGAVYDLGVPIYGGGMMGEFNDAVGLTLVKHYQSIRPAYIPSRILDLGCTIGNSTVPWKSQFTDAEVHGVDVAAPCLRYANARACALGHEVHFHQQNAENLAFEDESFDVVAAGLLLHETSRTALPKILAEAKQVLRPGGVMIMMDGFRPEPVPPLNAFFQEWEIYNNNESFLRYLISADVLELCRESGFEQDAVSYEPALFVTGQEEQGGEDQGYLTGFNKIPLLVGYA